MHKKTYKVLFLLIGLLTMAYMVYSLGFEDLVVNLQRMGWWFLPVFGSWLLIYLLNAIAFREVIGTAYANERKLPFQKVFQLTVSGYAINYVTPFVALGGEPYRIMELKPYLGEAKAGASVLLYGMMHILSHLLFWLVSIGLILWFLPIDKMVMVACATILILSICLIWWFSNANRKGVTITVLQTLARLPIVGKKIDDFKDRNKDVLEDTDENIRALYADRRSKFYASLSWEFLARVIGCAEIYFIARAIHIDMTYIEALIVSSGASLFANLIFFFPMQLGTREGGLAIAMASVGYASTAGIFIGIVTRVRELVWIGIGLLLMVFAKNRPK